MIPYIMCEGMPGKKLSENQRAYHISEFLNPEYELKVDKLYYIKNLISNPIGQLLRSIDGINFDGINFEKIAKILNVSKSDIGLNGTKVDFEAQDDEEGKRQLMDRFPENFKFFE